MSEGHEWEREYMNPPKRHAGGWVFKREISLGNVISIIIMAIPLVLWAITLDKRVSIVEASDARQERETALWKIEIAQQLTVIQHDIKRLLERRP